MGAIGPKVVLYMLPFAVAMILLAARIWQAAAHPAAMTNTGQADQADRAAAAKQDVIIPA
jgi:hypothetical protein